MSHYRASAITDEDLKNDNEFADYITENAGLETPPKSNFKGFETVTIKHDIITLSSKHLISYD